MTESFQMEVSTQEIHQSLKSIIDYQTHHRLREAQGRKRAEDLNDRVFWWSLTETISILTAAIAQVFILKSLFTEKRPVSYNNRL